MNILQIFSKDKVTCKNKKNRETYYVHDIVLDCTNGSNKYFVYYSKKNMTFIRQLEEFKIKFVFSEIAFNNLYEKCIARYPV